MTLSPEGVGTWVRVTTNKDKGGALEVSEVGALVKYLSVTLCLDNIITKTNSHRICLQQET